MSDHRTTDAGEAAYLKYLGFPVTFDRTNPKRVVCIFKGESKLLELKALDYYNNNTKVDAKGFKEAFDSIKKSITEGAKVGGYQGM